MQINVTYAPSVTDAPAGYQAAVQAAVQFFEATFDANITVNITFGWGEVGGQPMDPGAIGESLTTLVNAPIGAALLLNYNTSPAIVNAILSLPQNMQVTYLPLAEARVLGRVPETPTIPDGYVGLSSSAPFTFDPNNRAVAGKFDAIGALEHEISEVLGRQSFHGQPPPLGQQNSLLDLFRLAAPGVHTYATGPGYFSLNGDQLLLPFNDPSNGGDAGDWSQDVTGDSFDAFGETGLEEQVSAVDIRVLELLGYHLSSTAPTPNGTPTAPLSVTQAFQVASGQSLNFDGPFAIVMQPGAAFTLANSGTIVDTGFKSQTDVIGVATPRENSFASSTFSNSATGVLNVTATADAADAVGVYWGPSVFNAGLIQVTSNKADAWGTVGEPFTNAATGILRVQAADFATGVNLLWSSGGAFSNAGVIEVTAVHAVGVSGMTSFSNSGTLKAIGVGPGSSSDAVYITSPYATTFTNTGLIQGDYAFRVDPTYRGGTVAFSITNSGTINGKIDLVISDSTNNSQIHNTGSIAGAIQFSDGNSTYDGANGTQSGGIYLGHGTNTATLGNDGETVYGGGGSDTITGGTGNDFIEIARGNNTINGGGGFNTLSFADSDMGVTVNLGAGSVSGAVVGSGHLMRGIGNDLAMLSGGLTVNLGAGTATGANVSTISNIQQVIGSNFNDTLIAGSSAATLIAGSGHSTLTGGAGNDTLVAGAGGDTMTGNGGNDTFIFSSGDHQLVINDFGANGNQDVLKIYGYTAASSVQQQGADTLITLSGNDTILLKSVQAASLNGSNVVYSASVYQGPALPVSLPVFGTTTIYFTYDLTIAAGEIINELNQHVGLVDVGGGTSFFHALDNFGAIIVSTASGDVAGLTTDLSALGTTGKDITNEAGAVFSVSNSSVSGTAKGLFTGFSPAVVNAGSFSVTANGDAYGINTEDARNVTNAATGAVTVSSSGGDAYGIWALNGISGAGLVNSGSIHVSGTHAVYGIQSGRFEFSSIVNNGDITASGTGGAAATVGIDVKGFNSTSIITNTGTITAQTAIWSHVGPSLNITNSGTIRGAIQLANANNQIHNTGSIIGTILFGDGDSTYDGANGTQSGGIYLGHGTNTVTLGNDGETVFGGGGTSDTITGGSGNDFIEIGRGTNTINGGGGFNTLSFADSQVGYTVDLGAGTATGAGVSTISNIQQIIGSSFNDTLIAGSSAATLIAGSGHSTLTGGAGNDTLVAGAGGDTMTGNGGNDTFIFSSGDHQLVINDFGTGGYQDVLKIYGYAAAGAVQQQGANTLVTLSGSDTILLKNVQAASLNGSNVVYSASAYQGPVVPASPPVYFSSGAPILFTYDLTVFAGEELNIVSHTSDLNPNQNMGLLDESSGIDGSSGLDGRAFDNSGNVTITSSDPNLSGLLVVLGGLAVVTNRAGATFAVSDTSDTATGMNLVTFSDTFNNAGLLTVTGATLAIGVNSAGNGFTFTNAATGVVAVTSTAGDALGLSLPAGGTGGDLITNDGAITVTASRTAYGMQSVGGEFSHGFYQDTIVNNGTITAVGAQSFGIDVGGPYNPSTISHITNTGTITAQTAIINEAYSDGGYAPINISNSGTINGNVDLGGSDGILTNAGTITGNIFFSKITLDIGSPPLFGFGPQSFSNSGTVNGDVYLGSANMTLTNTGRIAGNILLSSGNDIIDLRGGGSVTGAIVITAPFPTASVNGAIYTGAAGGVISIHAGDVNITAQITAAAGSNTVVQYDESSELATLSQQPSGNWLVFAGSAGIETLSGIQSVRFTDKTFVVGTSANDTLTGTPGNETLLGGTGNDFLSGEFGNDTIDGGPGNDTAGYVSAPLGVTVSLAVSGPQDTVGAGTDTLINIENVAGSAFADTLTGNDGNNTLSGNDGNDTLRGGLGNDALDGGAGFDTASYAGVFANYSIIRLSDGSVRVADTVGGDGTDSVRHVEQFSFNGATKSIAQVAEITNFNVFWHHDGTDDWRDWTMTAGAPTGHLIGGAPTEWDIKATGDFNGDGISDAVWVNTSTGDFRALTYASDGSLSSVNLLATLPTSWVPVATGDFNGDGTSDILLEGQSTGDIRIWNMSNGNVVSTSLLAGGSLGPQWQVTGSGDFNGDGKYDLILKNTATGEIREWLLNGGTILQNTILGYLGADWGIAAVGDFNHDHTADILWRNTTTGDTREWQMSNGALAVSNVLPGPSPDWHVIATGDFDQSGTDDLMLQNVSTGDVREWLLDSSGNLASNVVLGGVPAGWNVAVTGATHADFLGFI